MYSDLLDSCQLDEIKKRISIFSTERKNQRSGAEPRINFFDGAKKSRGAKRSGASIFSGRLSSAATTATVLFMFFGLISTRGCFTTTGGG
jgi:hypothetical protein